MLVFTMIPAQFTQAAASQPTKINKITVGRVTDTTATIKWTQSRGATGYYLYRVNIQTNKKKLIAKLKSRVYNLTGLKAGKTYTYQVYGFKKSKGKITLSEEGSPIITVKPNTNRPAKVENFRLICNGDKSVFLAWDKVSNAESYVLFQYNKKTKMYEKIAKTTGTTYQVKNLAVGEVYKFIVRSFRTVNGVGAYSVESAVVKATGKNVDVAGIAGRRWGVTLKENVTTKELTTGKMIVLKKGTSAYTTTASGTVVTVYLSDGRKASVKIESLSFGNLLVTNSYDYYSVDQLEAYVNSKGYTSETDWLIWVNQYSSSVNIFKGTRGTWKLMRRMPCVIGEYGHTSYGENFQLIRRETAANRPQIYFTWNEEKDWGNSFHCLVDSNKRGPYSNGCVRLADSDLYYLSNNCPLGTRVVSH